MRAHVKDNLDIFSLLNLTRDIFKEYKFWGLKNVHINLLTNRFAHTRTPRRHIPHVLKPHLLLLIPSPNPHVDYACF